MELRWCSVVVVAWVCACGPPPVSVEDAGKDAGVGADGGGDAGGVDAGVDAGSPDDAGSDGGASDAGDADAGTPDAGVDDAGCPLASGVGAAFRVRVVASNLTSGNFQNYDPGHGQRILQALGADVALMQEFSFGNSSTTAMDSFVSATFDGGFSWFRGGPAGAGAIPNGVVSRWPLLAQGEWVDPFTSNRAFTWAKVDLPGPRDLWAISLHLLTSNPTTRANEARALAVLVRANIPEGDFLVIGGDFNTDVRDAGQEPAFTELEGVVFTHPPHPADQEGNENTNAGRTKPYDHVFASRCLLPLQVPVVLGSQQFDAGLVFDTRVYAPLAEVPPALQSDSAAQSMQHMGVVKDFQIQP